MIALIFLPFLAAAFVVAISLRQRFVRRAADPSRCASCGYALAGLAAGVLCPECGRPPRETPRPPARMPWYVYVGFVGTWLLPPVLVGPLSASAAAQAAVTWGIGSLLVAGCIAIVDGALPRRWALGLVLAVLVTMLAGGAYALSHAWAVAAGRFRASEYGPEFDYQLGVGIAGPILTTCAAMGLFVMAGLVMLVVGPRRRG
jgi:hypothetical protein